ncbi:MAG: glycosyltransferase family 2 protein [Bosea sp.]|jgi:dolichol-phosphate mannosyltransferase|nr:glycosyltransferase family 2 protein [Bosea sp. (in: a-proteobacteria)]
MTSARHALAPDLTVVVPTFNEAGNIRPLAARLAAALDGIAWEAIFVDDNSPDGTADVARALGREDPRIRCIKRIGRRGLSSACVEGMLAGHGGVVAVMDGDLQHDETILPRLFALVRSGEADLAVASRYVEGGSADSFSDIRGKGSRLATDLARKILKLGFKDPMSGFFATRRDVVEAAAPALSGEGFKILLDIAASHPTPLRVAEVPFVFGTRLHGASKMDNRVVADFLGLLVSKATGGLVSIRFLTFAAVGVSGVVVHLLALRGLLAIPALPFAAAQAGATLVAMTTNFTLNNMLTYKDRALSGFAFLKGLLGFYAVCSVGAIANVGVATWLFEGDQLWWIAGLAGAAMGAVWNYVFSDLVIWRKKR